MKTRPVKNAFQILLLLMALVAVGLLSAIATMSIAIHGAEVQVPALQSTPSVVVASVPPRP